MTRLTALTSPFDGGEPYDAEQKRRDDRSNLFVVAAIYSDKGSAPVRIRNMSRTGALIEGSALPPEDSRLRLSRGSLSVTGCIVWRRDNKAGIKFDSDVHVADWLPRGGRMTGQQRVDEMVYSCKAGVGVEEDARPPAEPWTGDCPDVAQDLRGARQALDSLAEELAADPMMAIRHPRALQMIDVTAQMLESLSNKVAAAAAR